MIRRWSRRRRIAAVLGVIALAGAGMLAVQRAVVLTWIGTLLVHEDPLARGDVVIPLTGGAWDREIEAANLLQAGYADTLLLTREPVPESVAYLSGRGIHLPTAHETRVKVLAALRVPPDRMAVIDSPVNSTREEAQVVADWAERHAVSRIIVVTSPLHTARAKYIFEREVGERGIAIIVRPAKLGAVNPRTWWLSRPALREGIFELEKLVAYRLRY